MILREKFGKAGLIIVTLVGFALSVPLARGQDAAWEGLINAGRNALQQRNYSEAERHFESALETAESFPSGDPRLGKSYNNLAAVYYAQEDYERAEPLMRRALAQLQETLGPNDSEVAQTMKNLAALYYLQGDRQEAEELLKQSLAILEEVHGPNHAFVATVLSNLAGLYQAENRYQDAEPLLTRSLAIWERLLGTDHPDVARSRELLAQLREAQGGDQTVETAASEPRSLTPLAAADSEANAGEGDDNNDEIARAVDAVEELTRRSKAEAGGVPVPALNPIGDAAEATVDAAAAASDDRTTPEEAIATSPTPEARPAILPETAAAEPESGEEAPGDEDIQSAAVDEEAAEAADDDPAPNNPVADPEALSGQDVAAAVLNKATSPVGDVSFAIYLSTVWSVDEARRYWQALQNAMPGILGEKQLEIEEVAAGDGADPFYRVLTKPYVSNPEAEAACERIRSQLRTHDCNVVVRDGAKATAGG